MEAHRLRRTEPSDGPALLALWERSVRATHDFVTDADIEFYRPLVAEFLLGETAELWTLTDEAHVPLGFLGLAGQTIDALFLEPAFRRQGGDDGWWRTRSS